MAQKKKAPAKKAVVKAPKRPSAIADKMTKSAMLASLSETTGLTKKEVGSVLDELEVLIERSVRKRGVGEFTVPGLLKVTTVKKPARKAKKNVPNPFKPGELMDVAAKPASIAVKIRPLKKLKEFALN
ncbi:MAG: nucleoid DNA-binding protein [Chitinophagales bacterium]|jgi:nucleoid DNA-binding protein|tara:strand:+ start:15300 stop:15683 length:384 start_codon:yes stop_codon:yes gene_type:complete